MVVSCRWIRCRLWPASQLRRCSQIFETDDQRREIVLEKHYERRETQIGRLSRVCAHELCHPLLTLIISYFDCLFLGVQQRGKFNYLVSISQDHLADSALGTARLPLAEDCTLRRGSQRARGKGVTSINTQRGKYLDPRLRQTKGVPRCR